MTMAKWTVHGFDGYAAYLQRIGANSKEIIGVGVYAMAKVIADNIKTKLNALPAVSNEANIATYKQGYSRLSVEEKKGLLDGFGVAPMQDDNGFWNVKIGFDGYNSIKTEKYPEGQPNPLIARITESGSSYRKKTPFVRPALNASKKPALEAGKRAIDQKIKELGQ